MKDFITEELEQGGLESLNTMLYAHLEAIEEVDWNKDKVLYHTKSIRHILKVSKDLFPRVNKLNSEQFQDS